MNLDRIIQQLKTYAPVFAGNVAGSANYAEGLETVVSLPMPACYVYPLDESADHNENMGWSLRQAVQERIAVVIVIDNSADRRGQLAIDSVESLKYAIFKAILNWNPTTLARANQGLRYDGGHLLGFDRARLFWQYEFTQTVTITEDDGFTVDGQPLTDIMFDPGYPGIDIDIKLPQ